jgi:hypothetical protein
MARSRFVVCGGSCALDAVAGNGFHRVAGAIRVALEACAGDHGVRLDSASRIVTAR